MTPPRHIHHITLALAVAAFVSTSWPGWVRAITIGAALATWIPWIITYALDTSRMPDHHDNRP